MPPRKPRFIELLWPGGPAGALGASEARGALAPLGSQLEPPRGPPRYLLV